MTLYRELIMRKILTFEVTRRQPKTAGVPGNYGAVSFRLPHQGVQSNLHPAPISFAAGGLTPIQLV